MGPLFLAKGMLVMMTIMMIGIDERRRKRRRAAVDGGGRDQGQYPDQETALGRVPGRDPDPEIVPPANLPGGTRRRKGIGTIAITVVESILMTKTIDGGIAVIDQDLAVVAAIGGGGIGAAHDLNRVIAVIAGVDLAEATAEVTATAGLRRAIVATTPNLQLPPSPLDLAFRVDQVGVVPVAVEGG